MELILWRHADAEEGVPDLDRNLTTKGRKQAARVADWLQHRLPSKFVLLSSPARRASQTAEALRPEFRVMESLAPGASAADIVEAAGWPRRRGVVVIVGHQPDLGRAASSLLAGTVTDWSIKKGGLWWLVHRLRERQAQTVVRAVIAPDLV
jgi:phosphohistidine phosphatase